MSLPVRFILILVCGGLFLAACSPSANKISVNSDLNSDGIINGEIVTANDPLAKYSVAVYEETEGQLCTGVILSDELILTAAHCVFGFQDSISISFTLDFQGTPPAELTRTISNLEVYSGWESRFSESKDHGDLALLRFAGGLPPGFKPAPLLPAELSQKLRVETKVDVLGFGMTKPADMSSAGILHKTQLETDNPHFSETEFTLNQNRGTGACHGDSGGPAFIQVNGQRYLIGIASRGINDDDDLCNQLSAYTKTWMYNSWIERASERLGFGF